MLPEGWVKTKLGALGRVKSGATPLRSEGDRYFSDSGYPWVKTMDLNNGAIISTDEYITDIALKETSCSIFPKGTVLVAMYGGFNQIGRTGILTKPSAINQAISAIQVSEDKAHSQYVLAFLNGYVSKWKRFAASSRKDPNITRDDVVGFPILLPPFQEQKKIAQILSTWDNAISATERLLENSQQRKKGLMQQLLTGKKRLPGFEGEWQWLRANEVFRTVSKKNNGDHEELLAVTQDQGVLPRSLLERRVVMPDGSTSGYKLVVPGNFIISLRSFQGGLEYSEYRGLVSPAYTVLEPIREINDAFYKQYYKSYDFIGHLAVAVVGIRDGKQISYSDFSFLKIPYPDVGEQQAIANVLTTADQEIDALQKRLDHLKQEKKALMQQLLTGKRRVQVDAAA
jgi:type I restriction enzyme S subunit